MIERYCKKCGLEIVKEGDCCTMYEGKKLCECDKIKDTIIHTKNKVSPKLLGDTSCSDSIQKGMEYFKTNLGLDSNTRDRINRTAIQIALQFERDKTNKQFELLLDMMDKKIEGFKKIRKGVIKNSKVTTAYDCTIMHLVEIRDFIDKAQRGEL